VEGQSQNATAPRRVLVIDDNKDAAQTLAEALKLLGHEAEAIFDALQVFDKVRTYKPDILFLDIGMPHIDGYTVAKVLRQDYGYENLKLVAVTAYTTEDDRRKARQAGFDAHVGKPADFEIIESILEVIR
jgi:CheY-like chemotaxis protein